MNVRYIDSTTKELTFNPKFEELYAPDVGPENPFKTNQQKAPKNMLSGYVEKAHVSEFLFENQRRTFASYGKLTALKIFFIYFNIKFFSSQIKKVMHSIQLLMAALKKENYWLERLKLHRKRVQKQSLNIHLYDLATKEKGIEMMILAI